MSEPRLPEHSDAPAAGGDEGGDGNPRPPRRTARRRDAAAAAPLTVATVGIVAAMVLFALAGIVHARTVPPFLPVDETSHVAYALLVGDGTLPTIDTPIPRGRIAAIDARLDQDAAQGREGRLDVWTANHPPLAPLLHAGPLRLGERLDRPLLGVALVRLLNVVFGTAAIGLVGVLGLLLAPRRPDLAVTAAGLVALVPAFPHITGLAYNDALMVLAATGTLIAAVLVVRDGHQPWSTALLCAGAATAAATRSAGFFVVGIAGLAALGAPLLHSRGDRPGRVAARSVGAGTLVAVTVAITSGWHHVGNVVRYGDPTGAAALFAKFEREPGPSTLANLVDPEFWVFVHDGVWLAQWGQLPGGTPVWLLRAVSIAACAGLFGAAFAWWRRGRLRPAASAATAWALGLLLPVLLLVSVAAFVAGGGNAHGRYQYPGLAVLGLVAAVGLAHLPGGRRGLPQALALVTAAGVSLAVWLAFVERNYADLDGSPVAVLEAVSLGGGVGAAVGAALAAASLATVIAAIGVLAPTARTDEQPPLSAETAPASAGAAAPR